MLVAFGTTVGISRGLNYVRERRRRVPMLRSIAPSSRMIAEGRV
jgi:hypothetical protein